MEQKSVHPMLWWWLFSSRVEGIDISFSLFAFLLKDILHKVERFVLHISILKRPGKTPATSKSVVYFANHNGELTFLECTLQFNLLLEKLRILLFQCLSGPHLQEVYSARWPATRTELSIDKEWCSLPLCSLPCFQSGLALVYTRGLQWYSYTNGCHLPTIRAYPQCKYNINCILSSDLEVKWAHSLALFCLGLFRKPVTNLNYSSARN